MHSFVIHQTRDRRRNKDLPGLVRRAALALSALPDRDVHRSRFMRIHAVIEVTVPELIPENG